MAKSIDFHLELFLNGKLPSIYSEVRNLSDNYAFFTNNVEEYSCALQYIYDVPPLFEIVYSDAVRKDFTLLKLKQYKGHAINITGFGSVEEYLKSRFGKNSRYKLRREINRLESCFNISYRMYYGEIERSEYDRIIDALYTLLEIRSNERGIENNRWLKTHRLIKTICYDKILKKEASLYVIYDNNEPIDICLNFHLNRFMYQLIRTYDIGYSKFNTGYINLIKHIEWCIDQNVTSISFGRGEYFWKQRWCNLIFNYDYHIIFKKQSVKNRIKAYLYFFKIFLLQLSRDYQIKEKVNRYFGEKTLGEVLDFEIMDEEFFNGKEKKEYNYKNDHCVKKMLFNYLWDEKEQKSDVVVYKITGFEDAYHFKGKKNQRSILLKNRF